MPSIVHLPTDDVHNQRPRLSKDEVTRHMDNVATCANVAPLELPREIATAYMAGVSTVVLARWFGVPVTTIRNIVNIQILGHDQVMRIMRRRTKTPATPAKPAATRVVGRPTDGGK